jgi:hypothetical protein
VSNNIARFRKTLFTSSLKFRTALSIVLLYKFADIDTLS